jgi:hypothetical protein
MATHIIKRRIIYLTLRVVRGGLEYLRLDYWICKGIGGDGFEEMRRITV